MDGMDIHCMQGKMDGGRTQGWNESQNVKTAERVCLFGRYGERERQRETDRDRQTERQRDKETKRQRITKTYKQFPCCIALNSNQSPKS